jgi:hypothetical protein
MGIPLLRPAVDLGPPRVAQPQQPRHLIKGFAGSVVAGAAHRLVLPVILHPDQAGVASRNQKAQAGRLQVGCGQKAAEEMALQVMYPNQGLIVEQRQGLGRHQPHQQGSHQARRTSYGNGIHLGYA